MKRNLLSILAVLLFQIGTGIAVNSQELTVSDIQDSGCLRETRANARAGEYGEKRTIILTKEGTSLTVQLLNYVSNCGTSGFDVIPSMSGGSDGTPYWVTIGVGPICYADMDCVCPYNVSFTVHGLEANSFYFSCWWCEGMVTLTDGEPLVLEDTTEDVSIGGLNYTLQMSVHSAKLSGGKSWEGDLSIPSEIVYEGQTYLVNNIGYNAFADNTALTSVSIPNSVTNIEGSAFIRCTGLTSIVIPESVKSLGNNVFYGCTNLASITIPNSVIQIGGSVFNGTAWYNSQPDGVVYAGGIAYTYKGTMPEGTQIDIKEGTIAIANNAFCRCDNLTSVTIPGSVSTIGYDAFMSCSGLESVTISEGVKIIVDAAFLYCSSLKSIVIPKSVTHIGEYAFGECTALTSATINGAITRMGRWAFNGCTALTHLDISNGVKDLGYETFANCTSLWRIKIPGSVTHISDGLFYRCSNLESIVISEGVEAIGYSAFGECSNMTYVILPNSLTKIDDYAFYNCSKLNEVICFAGDVPTTASNVFYNSPIAVATLHVPAGSVEKYKAAEPWNGFGNIVAIEEPHQPLPFLEGNPIWVYKYEHLPMPRVPDLHCWVDTGNRSFTYYFLGGQKVIEGKVYTMMGEIVSRGENITFNRWYPVREENGIVYTITDSLPGVIWHEYNDDYKMPYLQQGNECVLYNYSAEIGEKLHPQIEGSAVESYGTYQLMDGTACGVLKTSWEYLDLYEKLGFVNFETDFGIMDPLFGMILSTNGHVYSSRLNAFYQDGTMLYKAPNAQEGLCVNDTCWTRDDAKAYARSYKADPYQEKVFSFIRQLQMATKVTFTKGQMATIILPTAPDAGKGKYYKLDKCEDGKIIFEQELQPQAHIPYIIVPSEDFSIDTGTLDLAGLSPDTVSIAGISFIGSYSRKELNEQEGWYIDIIDTTPDCGFSSSGETGKGAFIGALRAYLTVNWDDPINHSGSKGPGDKLEIVLKDNGTGLTPTLSKGEGDEIINDKWYDLSGRRLPSKPAIRGIYIEDGKKKALPK